MQPCLYQGILAELTYGDISSKDVVFDDLVLVEMTFGDLHLLESLARQPIYCSLCASLFWQHSRVARSRSDSSYY